MKCVNNINVDVSSCLKSCSGLIVTTFFKNEWKRDLEKMFPVHGDYADYKKTTSHPIIIGEIGITF